MIAIVPAFIISTQAAINAYTSYVDALRTAHTVSGRVSVTSISPHRTLKYSEVFHFQLPNLMRLETWYGKRLDELIVGDANTYWDYTASPKYLIQQPNPPRFLMASGFLLEPFLNQSRDDKQAEYRAVSSSTPTSYHGHAALRIEISRAGKLGRPSATTGEVYMDPKTKIPIGLTLHSSVADTTTQMVFEDLKIDQPIDAGEFKYHPQIAANTDPKDDLISIGAKAPLFTGVALGEKPFSLASTLKGARATILNFWGLGCPACRIELPKLQALQNRFGARGLKVVTFQPLDDAKILSAYLKGAHLSLTTVFEGSCKPFAVESAYRGAIGEPVTYLIDANGVIVAHYMTSDVSQLTNDLGTRLGLR